MANGSIIHAGAKEKLSHVFDFTYRNKAASYDTGDNLQSHAFSTDGFTLYTGNNSDQIREHTLSTPFDITTASFVTAHNTGGANEIEFNEDGTILNLLDYQTAYTTFDLTTPFDISSRTNQRTLNTLGQEEGFVFAKSGSEIHICRRDARRIEIYSLSSPYDATTRGSLQYEFTTDVRSGSLMDIFWSDDGKTYYTLYRNPSRLEQLTVTRPFDPRSPAVVSYRDSKTLDDGADTDQKTITWSTSGDVFHHAVFDSRKIYQWQV